MGSRQPHKASCPGRAGPRSADHPQRPRRVAALGLDDLPGLGELSQGYALRSPEGPPVAAATLPGRLRAVVERLEKLRARLTTVSFGGAARRSLSRRDSRSPQVLARIRLTPSASLHETQACHAAAFGRSRAGAPLRGSRALHRHRTPTSAIVRTTIPLVLRATGRRAAQAAQAPLRSMQDSAGRSRPGSWLLGWTNLSSESARKSFR